MSWRELLAANEKADVRQAMAENLPMKGTMLARVLRFNADSDDPEDFLPPEKNYVMVYDIAEANIVTSRTGSGRHKVVLDIDHNAALVLSTTPGHYHLYIDVEIEDKKYWEMLEALVAAGVISAGYESASKRRGFTAVRLPWVKKSPHVSDNM